MLIRGISPEIIAECADLPLDSDKKIDTAPGRAKAKSESLHNTPLLSLLPFIFPV
jgi:hypothetical protein